MLTTAGPIKVRVGNGSKAHLFEPRDGANAKVFALHDGMTAYDHVLCGQSGALNVADDDMDVCKTCSEVRARRPD